MSSNTTLSYPVQLNVTEDLEVTVIPHDMHEWLMPTLDVAKAYGVDKGSIRKHLINHKDEIVKGQHFIEVERNAPHLGATNSQPRQRYYTKAGVIRLGFYIRSQRAKMFRDWAEKVILTLTAPTPLVPAITEPAASQPFTQVLGTASSLPSDRLIDILSIVALVEDSTLRRALVQQLNPGIALPAQQYTPHSES